MVRIFMETGKSSSAYAFFGSSVEIRFKRLDDQSTQPWILLTQKALPAASS